ncbi:bis(5'-nucleosyl)-tetraphosphatase (symmetrical) YqeK [Candidatus Margulisiibacteriota bacterium]
MIDVFKDKLRETLSPRRFSHSLEVARIASELAKNYGLDPQKAEIAGLLHDCAKEIPFPLLLSKADQYGLEIDDIEKTDPKLLHALVGALVAYEEFGIKDDDILSAISKHTTGSREMSPLDQIIYVADYIDPLRNFQNIELIKELAYTDLNKAVCQTAKQILDFLNTRNMVIHPKTVECLNNHE